MGLRSVAQATHQTPCSFTIIGKGPEQAWLEDMAQNLGVNIDWIPWMSQEALVNAYLHHDVLLFPSLHDTSPNVIIEAFSCGLPVVCLDLGGPGVMVDDSCGRVIKTADLDEETVVEGLANALLELAGDPDLRRRLSEGAINRSRQFDFKQAVECIYPDPGITGQMKDALSSNLCF